MRSEFVRSVCLGLASLLLFAQLAVAAYVCPGLGPERVASAHEVPGDGVPGTSAFAEPGEIVTCEGMSGGESASFSNLCTEHCRFGEQSDLTSPVAVPAVTLNERYTVPVLAGPAIARHPAAVDSALVAASPPHAILHCCFRI